MRKGNGLVGHALFFSGPEKIDGALTAELSPSSRLLAPEWLSLPPAYSGDECNVHHALGRESTSLLSLIHHGIDLKFCPQLASR